jgi:ribose-phosphate pyrophosphokinase
MPTHPLIDPGEVRFFSGSSNRPLASTMARSLNLRLEDTLITRFSNDNLYIQLGVSVRSRVVFIVQSLTPPVNDHLMELLMMIDIARSAAAREIHAVIPYYSFARSDKKDAPRISITAKLVAELIERAGATHVMTMTLHSPQVHGFFSVPTDPLTARFLFTRYFRKRDLSDTIVVTPDSGGAKSTARFANSLGLPNAYGNKERISDSTVRIAGLMGHSVSGYKRAIIYDDEIATGGSVVELCRILIDGGVEEIWVSCTHGVFTGNAFERLASIPQITEIVTTDTVYIPEEKRPKTLRVLSVAPIFAEAIRRNYTRMSIGGLFDFGADEKS